MIFYNPEKKIDLKATKEAMKDLNDSFKIFQKTHAEALAQVFQFMTLGDFDRAIHLLKSMELALSKYREFAQDCKKDIEGLR